MARLMQAHSLFLLFIPRNIHTHRPEGAQMDTAKQKVFVAVSASGTAQKRTRWTGPTRAPGLHIPVPPRTRRNKPPTQQHDKAPFSLSALQ